MAQVLHGPAEISPRAEERFMVIVGNVAAALLFIALVFLAARPPRDGSAGKGERHDRS
jgi:hypothetical protein